MFPGRKYDFLQGDFHVTYATKSFLARIGIVLVADITTRTRKWNVETVIWSGTRGMSVRDFSLDLLRVQIEASVLSLPRNGERWTSGQYHQFRAKD